MVGGRAEVAVFGDLDGAPDDGCEACEVGSRLEVGLGVVAEPVEQVDDVEDECFRGGAVVGGAEDGDLVAAGA